MTIIGNARTIAGFIENVAQQPLPVDVENAARMCLADWVAVALGAYDQTAGQLARDVASSWHPFSWLAPLRQSPRPWSMGPLRIVWTLTTPMSAVYRT